MTSGRLLWIIDHGATLMLTRRRPGEVRDAIVDYLRSRGGPASVTEIEQALAAQFEAPIPASSVRSYLQLNSPGTFTRVAHGTYLLSEYKSALAPQATAL